MTAATRYPARVRVTGYAASELDIRSEVACVGDADYRLLAQWDGSAIVVFDAEHAVALAESAGDLSNHLDALVQGDDLDACPEEKLATRYACQGLATISYRLGMMGAA